MTKILHKIWHEFLKALFWMRLAVCWPDIMRAFKQFKEECDEKDAQKSTNECGFRNEGRIGFRY